MALKLIDVPTARDEQLIARRRTLLERCSGHVVGTRSRRAKFRLLVSVPAVVHAEET